MTESYPIGAGRSSPRVDSQPDSAGDSLENTARDRARRLVEAALDSQDALADLGKWLVETADRQETAADIAGVADALLRRSIPLPSREPPRAPSRSCLADTCGTGGDGSGTFNISTAAGLVAAACGLRVAKHGNRAVSSRTGSADVLEQLGVRVDIPPQQVAECLDRTGFCFCLAPRHHPAMAAVSALRRSLGRPTVFNLVGPLCNPAGVDVQVIGVGRASVREAMAEAARALGLGRVLIVSGAFPGPAGASASLDEVSLFGETQVIDVEGPRLERLTWTPEDFGLATLATGQEERLLVDGPGASAAMIRSVLAGDRGPARDVVVLNAAAVLWAGRVAVTLPAARARAEQALDSGDAARLLAAVVAATAGGVGKADATTVASDASAPSLRGHA
jgi:anthranilate phosphoribosyltransferase